MFCTNCGKEIIDTARFCNFCGAPVKNAAVPPVQPVQQPIYPQPAPEPVQPMPTEQAKPEQTNISETSASGEIGGGEAAGSIPDTAPEENAFTEVAAEPDEISDTLSEPFSENASAVPPSDGAFPRPNVIPTAGESTSASYAQPSYPSVPTAPIAPVVPVQSAVPAAKPERKYTFGHIMMCLAAVAVMAIVAGVFAGLYFSVV